MGKEEELKILICQINTLDKSISSLLKRKEERQKLEAEKKSLDSVLNGMQFDTRQQVIQQRNILMVRRKELEEQFRQDPDNLEDLESDILTHIEQKKLLLEQYENLTKERRGRIEEITKECLESRTSIEQVEAKLVELEEYLESDRDKAGINDNAEYIKSYRDSVRTNTIKEIKQWQTEIDELPEKIIYLDNEKFRSELEFKFNRVQTDFRSGLCSFNNVAKANKLKIFREDVIGFSEKSWSQETLIDTEQELQKRCKDIFVYTKKEDERLKNFILDHIKFVKDFFIIYWRFNRQFKCIVSKLDQEQLTEQEKLRYDTIEIRVLSELYGLQRDFCIELDKILLKKQIYRECYQSMKMIADNISFKDGLLKLQEKGSEYSIIGRYIAVICKLKEYGKNYGIEDTIMQELEKIIQEHANDKQQLNKREEALKRLNLEEQTISEIQELYHKQWKEFSEEYDDLWNIAYSEVLLNVQFTRSLSSDIIKLPIEQIKSRIVWLERLIRPLKMERNLNNEEIEKQQKAKNMVEEKQENFKKLDATEQEAILEDIKSSQEEYITLLEDSKRRIVESMKQLEELGAKYNEQICMLKKEKLINRGRLIALMAREFVCMLHGLDKPIEFFLIKQIYDDDGKVEKNRFFINISRVCEFVTSYKWFYSDPASFRGIWEMVQNGTITLLSFSQKWNELAISRKIEYEIRDSSNAQLFEVIYFIKRLLARFNGMKWSEIENGINQHVGSVSEEAFKSYVSTLKPQQLREEVITTDGTKIPGICFCKDTYLLEELFVLRDKKIKLEQVTRQIREELEKKKTKICGEQIAEINLNPLIAGQVEQQFCASAPPLPVENKGEVDDRTSTYDVTTLMIM